jgi:hypothetical protein
MVIGTATGTGQSGGRISGSGGRSGAMSFSAGVLMVPVYIVAGLVMLDFLCTIVQAMLH